jgi:hypothetical protein
VRQPMITYSMICCQGLLVGDGMLQHCLSVRFAREAGSTHPASCWWGTPVASSHLQPLMTIK